MVSRVQRIDLAIKVLKLRSRIEKLYFQQLSTPEDSHKIGVEIMIAKLLFQCVKSDLHAMCLLEDCLEEIVVMALQ